MKRITVCAWAGFVAYAVCLFAAGPAGFSSMKRLEAEKERLALNLNELRTINESLALRVDALKGDRETIAIEGRRFGYLSPGERLVKVSGRGSTERFMMAGRILKAREAPAQGGFLPVCAGALVALAVFLLSLAFRGKGAESGE